jgi:hypothetical protein
MLYFSPLSVTDDKQLDRKHPFSFPQCSQSGQNGPKQVSAVRDVDVAGWGTVSCMQWWCCGFVFDDVDNFNDSAPSTEVL